MFAKRLIQKAMKHQHNSQDERKNSTDLNVQVVLHYGIPYTASILAFDPIQRLLAIGTLDGRIKIIGGDNIEGLLISPKKVPYKSLEFLHNKGFLVSVSNENDIQIWNLECRQLAYSFQWEANITAFAVIHGTYLMYVGDENGLLSVLKYENDERNLLRLPYKVPANALIEAAGVSFPGHQSIVGILPQPFTSGTRVLIAYENGLLILWDVSEGDAVCVRGHTELQLMGVASIDYVNDGDHEQEDREICSLCWASNTGSVLAVGYINGDILLWDISSDSSIKGQAGKSTNSVARLQLASGNRRLPVIILHWSAHSITTDDKGGHLFIYGGDEMGSEEVLTVLNLEWSSGIESLRCISRVELDLNGSFADMTLIPNAENNFTAALFVLTNPGHLDVYDGAMLSSLKSKEGKPSALVEKFPVVVPAIDPCITITKLCLLHMDKSSSTVFLEKADDKTAGATPILSAGTKWPLTGGVPSDLSEECGIRKIYIAGYQDGSVRIWNATYPVLKLISVLEGKVPGIEVGGDNAGVSALDFCSLNMSMAVGNVYGLIRVYKLHQSTDESSFHFVSETKQEVAIVHRDRGFCCTAAFFLLNSAIRTLQFTNHGDRLAVGFDRGEVAVLDLNSISILFCTASISATNSPVISIGRHLIPKSDVLINSLKDSSSKSSGEPEGVALLILTKDAHVIAIDSTNGNMLSSRPMHPKKESAAISMYVLEGGNAFHEAASEKCSQHLSDDTSIKSELTQGNSPCGSKVQEVGQQCSSDASHYSDTFQDPLLLLCCEDALRLYSLESVIQGNNNHIHKVNLIKHCCWATTFKRRDDKVRGLILLYQTGILETRSLPDLEVLSESSLMSILRWSFKTDMDKAMSSYENGQITLVNGCEVAFLSLSAVENDFRIPESLPCLHDEVLAAASDAAISLSINQNKRQNHAPGIIGGIIRGLKGGKAEKDANTTGSTGRSSFSQQVEGFFSMLPFPDSSRTTMSDQEVDELSIDDIEIDDVSSETSTSSLVKENNSRGTTDEEKDREKLFQGATNDMKPRVRTTQEILTKYRFGGDASAAAAHAKDKLMQRQEKLQRISQRTEELQNGAEDFASMANELVKTMENKKWWKI